MMNFCNLCGNKLKQAIPEGDNRHRHICTQCENIHYQNPRVIVGCIPVWDGKILLCRRNIEPRLGLWTVPAGFLELDETLEQGALRETKEESLAEVEIEGLHGLYDIPEIGQIYALFLARMLSPEFGATPESSEVDLFSIADIPWDQLAFKVVHRALEQYVQRDNSIPVQPFRMY